MLFPKYISFIFFAALMLKSLIINYLDRRNFLHIEKNKKIVPSKFSKQITLQDHLKAQNYTQEKLKVQSVFRIWDLIILLLLTFGGGLDLLTMISYTYSANPINSGMLFFFMLGILTTILSYPESLYSTFVVEAKYGFNKTTWKIFIIDQIKGFVLALILGAPLLWCILTFMNKFSTNWWLYAFILVSVFQLLIIYIYPTWIAPLFNKFSSLENPDLEKKVIDLLSRVEFESKGLFVMDASKRSSHGNAYFTGFGKNKRIVFFDTLLSSLNANEVIAVLGHEIGHMKLNHIKKRLFISLISSFLGFFILGYLKTKPEFFIGHGITQITDAAILTIFSMVSGVYTFFLIPIQAFYSRKHEYEADKFSSDYTNAQDLITALVKMYKDNASSLTPDPWYSKFYYSHPTALERVEFLEQLTLVKKASH